MIKPAESNIDKGGQAEEALRVYFRQLGGFVVRGVKIRAGRDHVTDVDLWIYNRSSIHARHISIVDIKNKKRAKGYERLIWLKGLQLAVEADEAIVATTASKDDLKMFADRLGIRLMSSNTFKAIVMKYSEFKDRFSSEDLEGMWRPIRLDSGVNLAAKMEYILTEIGNGLSFTSINIWIDEAVELLVYLSDHERVPGPVARASLLCASLVAIAADYVGRNTAFGDVDDRRGYFREGLLFGNAGEGSSDRYVSFAEMVAKDYLDQSGAAGAAIRSGFKRSIENLPIGPFIDFFSRPAAGKELIDAANQLETAAFSKTNPDFSQLPAEAKTIIGLLLDYAGLDRRRFLRPPATVDQELKKGLLL